MQEILVDTIPFRVSPTAINESLEKNNGMYVVEGIIQKANQRNGNGRVYPRHVLERALRNYQNQIENGNALGCLDHDECFTNDNFEVLTDDGWKFFEDISEDDKVLSLNINTKEYEYKSIKKKIIKHYDGDSYILKNRSIDTQVTSNHKFLLEDRYGNISYHSISDIYENRKKFNKHKILKTGNWCVDDPEYIVIDPVLPVSKSGRQLKKYYEPLCIDPKVFAGFMGIWLSEGTTSKNQGNGGVAITQNLGTKADEIRSLLKTFPVETKEYISKNGLVTFHLSDRRLSSYLSNFGLMYEKYVPKMIRNLSAECLDELLYYFNLGDGRAIKSCGRVRKNVFSTSRKLISTLHECLIKAGGCGNWQDLKNRTCKLGDESKNTRDMYQLEYASTKGIYLLDSYLEIPKVRHIGNVYCLSTEDNENFYIRQNNKAFITGNSTEVKLATACLRILKIWWNGDDVWAKIQILSTPSGNTARALFSDGVNVGISSRALGSIKKTGDFDEVEDDLSIAGFDLVSTPSTPGAYLKILKESLHLHKNIEKYMSVDRVISSILTNI